MLTFQRDFRVLKVSIEPGWFWVISSEGLRRIFQCRQKILK